MSSHNKCFSVRAIISIFSVSNCEVYKDLAMKRSDITVPIVEKDFEELSASERELVDAARDIVRDAYAPYSKFRVGASLRLMSGRIVTGSNQENAAYPSGICAERTALFYAGAQYPDDPVVALCITALREDDAFAALAAPCGACRQVILETADRHKHSFPVYLAGPHSVKIVEDCRLLLPINFDASSL